MSTTLLISDGDFAAALKYVNADLDENGLTAFDASDPRERNQAVASTMAVSLARLNAQERERYRELAVLCGT